MSLDLCSTMQNEFRGYLKELSKIQDLLSTRSKGERIIFSDFQGLKIKDEDLELLVKVLTKKSILIDQEANVCADCELDPGESFECKNCGCTDRNFLRQVTILENITKSNFQIQNLSTINSMIDIKILNNGVVQAEVRGTLDESELFVPQPIQAIGPVQIEVLGRRYDVISGARFVLAFGEVDKHYAYKIQGIGETIVKNINIEKNYNSGTQNFDCNINSNEDSLEMMQTTISELLKILEANNKSRSAEYAKLLKLKQADKKGLLEKSKDILSIAQSIATTSVHGAAIYAKMKGWF